MPCDSVLGKPSSTSPTARRQGNRSPPRSAAPCPTYTARWHQRTGTWIEPPGTNTVMITPETSIERGKYGLAHMNEWFDAEHHVERAHEHYEAGRWTEAETELRHALSLNPYRPDWHFNLGLTL